MCGQSVIVSSPEKVFNFTWELELSKFPPNLAAGLATGAFALYMGHGISVHVLVLQDHGCFLGMYKFLAPVAHAVAERNKHMYIVESNCRQSLTLQYLTQWHFRCCL